MRIGVCKEVSGCAGRNKGVHGGREFPGLFFMVKKFLKKGLTVHLVHTLQSTHERRLLI